MAITILSGGKRDVLGAEAITLKIWNKKMIKKKEDMSQRPIEIDLTGPHGNAYYLLALANELGKQLGYNKFKRKCIRDEMMLADYECLLQTFDREFGMIVTLYR